MHRVEIHSHMSACLCLSSLVPVPPCLSVCLSISAVGNIVIHEDGGEERDEKFSASDR